MLFNGGIFEWRDIITEVSEYVGKYVYVGYSANMYLLRLVSIDEGTIVGEYAGVSRKFDVNDNIYFMVFNGEFDVPYESSLEFLNRCSDAIASVYSLHVTSSKAYVGGSLTKCELGVYWKPHVSSKGLDVIFTNDGRVLVSCKKRTNSKNVVGGTLVGNLWFIEDRLVDTKVLQWASEISKILDTVGVLRVSSKSPVETIVYNGVSYEIPYTAVVSTKKNLLVNRYSNLKFDYTWFRIKPDDVIANISSDVEIGQEIVYNVGSHLAGRPRMAKIWDKISNGKNSYPLGVWCEGGNLSCYRFTYNKIGNPTIDYYRVVPCFSSKKDVIGYRVVKGSIGGTCLEFSPNEFFYTKRSAYNYILNNTINKGVKCTKEKIIFIKVCNTVHNEGVYVVGVKDSDATVSLNLRIGNVVMDNIIGREVGITYHKNNGVVVNDYGDISLEDASVIFKSFFSLKDEWARLQ